MTKVNFNSNFSGEDVKRMAKELYGLHNVTVKPMASEIDLNFFLQDETGSEYIFKIANSRQERDILEAQHQAMKHLAAHHTTLKCPEV